LGGNQRTEFWALPVTAARMRGSLRSLVGVECATCADGMALHVMLSVTLRGCATSVGMLLRPGVTTFWRRGVAIRAGLT
jgi:hypothetical protein